MDISILYFILLLLHGLFAFLLLINLYLPPWVLSLGHTSHFTNNDYHVSAWLSLFLLVPLSIAAILYDLQNKTPKIQILLSHIMLRLLFLEFFHFTNDIKCDWHRAILLKCNLLLNDFCLFFYIYQ